MKLKRIATVAAIGLLAVAGMSACRVESGAALFVQDTRIDESRVNDIVADAPKDPETGDLADPATARQNVIAWLTEVELAKRVSADTQVPLPGPQYNSENDAYARLHAEAIAYEPVLAAGAVATELTDADATRILSPVTKATGQPASEYTDQLTAIFGDDQAKQYLGIRKSLMNLMAKYNVLANPRYGDVGIGIVLLPLTNPSNGQQFRVTLTAPIPTS